MDLLEKYSILLNKLSGLDGVFGVYIFGSYAKGKSRKKSDLDICFFIDTNNKDLYEEIISSAGEELDISIFTDLPLSVQFDVLKNGQVFKINNLEKFKDIKMRALRKYKDESWVYKNSYFKRYGVRV